MKVAGLLILFFGSLIFILGWWMDIPTVRMDADLMFMIGGAILFGARFS